MASVSDVTVDAPRPGRAQVHRLLETLSRAELDGWDQLWADDALLELPFAGPTASSTVTGRDAITDYFATGLALFSPFVFEDVVIFETVGDQLVAEWKGTATMLSSGGNYENRYIAVFEFSSDGRISRYRQYLNPDAFVRAQQG